MASFINLMASDVWSDADIKSRLHAEIRSTIGELAETELNRALQGKMMGLHVLSVSEQASLTLFKTTTDQVAVLGIAARADMLLLNGVLALEAARTRLKLPAVTTPATVTTSGPDGSTLTVVNPAIAKDASARTAAQLQVDSASPQVLSLALLRTPPPPPPPPVQVLP